MKKVNILFLLVGIAAFFAACSHDDDGGPVPPQPREQVGRTVLVYIVGDNGVSELSGLFKENFKDMVEGMKEVDYSKCNLVVYSEMVDDVPRLISLKNKNGQVIADTIFTYPEQNPLDKTVMSEVIARTLEYFPADSYGFAYLSHSSSWVPAYTNANSRSIGYYRRTQMEIADLRDVLLSSFPKPLKYILFDCCSMQSVEVAYELRHCAEYFIGSPTEIPGPGAPYKTVVPELFTDTDLPLNIARAYYDFYDKSYTGATPTNANWTGGIATSVIESGALEDLAVATKAILSKYVQDQRLIDRSGILLYDFNDYANYDFDELVQYLTGGTDNADYQNWKAIFDAAVIFRETTTMNYSGIASRMFSMVGSEGLSTWIPFGSIDSRLNTFYHTLSWYTAAGWNETGW